MRVINKDHNRLLTVNDPLVIYVFADTHIGSSGFNQELLEHHIEMCRTENAYWVHLGDWVEAIGPLDKRFDIRDTENPIVDQYREAFYLFEPIKDNCIAVLSGNHDEVISHRTGDFILDLSDRLKVPYLGYGGFVKLRAWHSKELFERRRQAQHQITLFLHHGHGMGALLGAKAINLQRLSHKYRADVYIIGHIHTYLAHTDSILTLKHTYNTQRTKIAEEYRHYASCPSYCNGYKSEVSNYAERKALYPQPNGCLRVSISRSLTEISPHIEITPILGGVG